MPTARSFYRARLVLIPDAIWWALYSGGVVASTRTMIPRAVV